MTGTAQAFIDFGDGVQVWHHDWRTDERAVAQPWSVRVNGTEVSRHGDAGSAGAAARAIADGAK